MAKDFKDSDNSEDEIVISKVLRILLPIYAIRVSTIL